MIRQGLFFGLFGVLFVMKKGGFFYSLLPKFPVGNEEFTFYHLRKSDKGADIGLYNIKLISNF